MPDRTQDLKNHRQVAVACKNYTDSEIKKSEGRILSIVARNNVSYIDHTDEATYRFTAPANSKLLMLQSIAGNSVKYAPTTASDTTTAYQKNVPSYSPSIDRASANINTLGGMSYKSENLIPLTDIAETTTNGITYSVSNGVITLNGTASGGFFLYVLNNISLTLGTGTYSLATFNTIPSSPNGMSLILYSGDDVVGSVTAGNSTSSFTLNATTTITSIRYWIPQGMSFINYVNKPMLVSGSTAPTTFEPYYSGIRDIAPTSVKSVGANLAGGTIIENQGYAQDGGTYSSNDTNIMSLLEVMPNTTYSKNNDVWINYYDENQTFISQDSGDTFTTPSNCKYIGLTIPKATPNLMLNYGSTALPYKEYVGTIDTLSIPAQVQALDGYGWGVNSTCYNYIDFNAKKFIKKVGRVDLGSIKWEYYNYSGDSHLSMRSYGIADYVKKASSSSIVSNLLCKFESASGDNVWNETIDGSIAIGTDGVIQIYSSIMGTDPQAFKTAMSGVYLYYELATPVETDISAYLTTNEIEIEPNGTLSFESTYSAYVPSNVSYNGVIKHALATAVKLEGANLSPVSTGDTNFLIDNQLLAGTYTISFDYSFGNDSNWGVNLRKNNESGEMITIIWLSSKTGNVTQQITLNESCKIYVNCHTQCDVTNIMLNRGSTALSYRPHKATVTRDLPYQASDGWSAGSVRNVRVFSDDEGNVVSKRETNVGNQDLGDLNYSILSSTDFPNYFVSSAITGLKSQTTNILNPIYAVNNTAYTNMNNMQIRVETNSVITARNDNFNNSTIFKSAMSGVSLFYELDDEHKTESDMDDFDYFFDCEEGDTFTLVNTEQLQCYATYSFLIKEAKSNE